jgi:hypothetical protein
MNAQQHPDDRQDGLGHGGFWSQQTACPFDDRQKLIRFKDTGYSGCIRGSGSMTADDK